VTLTAVNLDRAFVVFGTRFDSTDPSATHVTGQLASATTLAFTRTASSGAPAIPIQYYVAEFQSGVRVLRGSVAMTQPTMVVPLSKGTDLGTSFPIITYRNTGNTYGEDDFVRAKLTGPKELTLSTGLAAPNCIVEWQVITVVDSIVQSGDLTMGSTDTVLTAALPQQESTSATWLLVTNQVANPTGTAAELMAIGRMIASNILTFDRALGGATNQITWYAVTFTNGTTVQSSTAALADTAGAATAPLTQVDPARSIAVTGGTWLSGGTTAFATSADPGYASFTLDLGAGTQLSLARGASGGTSKSNVGYSVIQFN
jgi:hypothetical protein